MKVVEEEFEGAKFIVQAGDYGPLLAKTVKELEKVIVSFSFHYCVVL